MRYISLMTGWGGVCMLVYKMYIFDDRMGRSLYVSL